MAGNPPLPPFVRKAVTPDLIAPDPRDDEKTAALPDDGLVDAEPTHRVKVYDGLVVDPAGDPGTIGADANGA